MATDAFSTAGHHILVKDNPYNPTAIIEATTTGTDIKPGMIVTFVGETDPAIDICAAGEEPGGIVLRNPDHDLDTAYAAGKTVRVARCGGGCVVRFWVKANSGSFVKGQPIGVNQTSPEMGALWSYADAAEATDTLNFRIGRAWKAHTNDASDDKVSEVVLDG